MFAHVVEKDGHFYVRRWLPLLGFQWWDARDGYWWMIENGTPFGSADEARETFSRKHTTRFAGWA